MPPISTTSASAFNNATVSSSALELTDIGFTQVEVDVAYRMRVTVETNPIRYRYDGTAPTASVGHLLPQGGELILVEHENIVNFQVIRDSSDAAIFITLES